MQELFKSIFDSTQTNVSVGNFLLCILISLVAGLIYLLAYSYKNKTSGSFKTAIFILPTIVSVVIMMVNGNIGAGVAVAGAFSLVRFRSAQGSAKEICAIFAAMCSGLIIGTGYLAFGILFSILACVIIAVSNVILKKSDKKCRRKTLKITIPEDLDYGNVFDDVFSEFSEENELVNVKTVNLGSMFRLTYELTLKKDADEKKLVDKLRERNGNLEIVLSKVDLNSDGL